MCEFQFDQPFIESYFEDYFGEFTSDIFVSLKKKNPNYKTILEKREKILCDFPNLRTIVEDDESMALSQEEVSALIKFLGLVDDSNMIQEKELFLRGVREAYYLFKKTKIIK